MISDTARYPDPVHSVPAKLRADGERAQHGWDLDKLSIAGNEGGPIPSEHLAWLPSLPANAPASLIRATYEREGVVHVRGLLPRAEVLAVRRRFFERASTSHPGLLKPGSNSEEGLYSGLFGDEIVGNDPLAGMRTGANYERFVADFVQHPHILRMAGALKPAWREPWAFRQQVLRSNLPGAQRTATRVHYDQMYLRGMEPDALTAWIPLGDISPVGGGLMYLERSVDLGSEIEGLFKVQNAGLPEEAQLDAFNENMLAGGGLTTDSARFAASTRRRWLVADYRAGDVVFHQCCQVHCSAANADAEGRIRLSTDVRFADKKASFEERWW